MAKSKEEVKFDKVFDKYFDTFNKSYPYSISDTRPLSEHIRIMEDAIKSGKEVKPIKYKEGCDY